MNPLQSVDVAIVLVLKIIDNAEKSSSSLSWYYSYLQCFRQDAKQKFGENKHWLEEITEGENVQKNMWQYIIVLQNFLINR